MDNPAVFQIKDQESEEVTIRLADIEEIIPDADMRFSLVILKKGDKHFVRGTKQEILQKLGGEKVPD